MKIPLLACPYEPRVSAYAQHVEDSTRSYIRQHGILHSKQALYHYDHTGFGQLAARIYPDAGKDELTLISRWIAIWAIFDDQLEKVPDEQDREVLNAVFNTAESWFSDPFDVSSETAESPFRAALLEMLGEIAKMMSKDWVTRFLADARDYLVGARWEAGNRFMARTPTLDSYTVARRRFGGIRMAMDLAELGGRYELPSEVLDSSPLVEAVDNLGDIALWANDIFSLTVDLEEGNVSNLVLVLQGHWEESLEQATGRAIAMLEDRVGDLPTAEVRLRDWSRATGQGPTVQRDIERYIDGMHTWISGNDHWSRGNERYRTAVDRVSDLQPNLLLQAVDLTSRTPQARQARPTARGGGR
ncbi:terpene synthase family protein [Streptomyces sp. FIT100]|uniref:terpene synthase family protein n=1 Tax=Streptomyces sp. FIT100 TaxID=2837956 RepID=UPI0021C6BD28|nr:hypothetical protein [Streptomyces sp. FIT100]UUN28874.1 hypothetical protein KK483_22665 [Streptomyces sp. FIT100]